MDRGQAHACATVTLPLRLEGGAFGWQEKMYIEDGMRYLKGGIRYLEGGMSTLYTLYMQGHSCRWS